MTIQAHPASHVNDRCKAYFAALADPNIPTAFWQRHDAPTPIERRLMLFNDDPQLVLLTAALFDHDAFAACRGGLRPEHFADEVVRALIFGCVGSAQVYGWPDIDAIIRVNRRRFRMDVRHLNALLDLAECGRMALSEDLIAWAARVLVPTKRDEIPTLAQKAAA